MASSHAFNCNLRSSTSYWKDSDDKILSVIRQVVHAKLRPSTTLEFQEASDVVSTTLVAVFQALSRTRIEKIYDCEAYARKVASHEVSQHLAKKYPNRVRVVSTIVDIVSESNDLEIIRNGRAGVRKIRIKDFSESYGHSFEMTIDDQLTLKNLGSLHLRTILLGHGGSMPLYQFASVLQSLLHLEDQSKLELKDSDRVATTQQIDKNMEAKTELQDLWNCILTLSMEHRCALLLNLRDYSGKCDVHTLIESGATIPKELGEALGWKQSEVDSLIQKLPLSDDAISRYMNVDIGKIFGLRFAARRSLKKKMKNLGWS